MYNIPHLDVIYSQDTYNVYTCIYNQARVEEFVRGGGGQYLSLFFCFSIFEGMGPSSENS